MTQLKKIGISFSGGGAKGIAHVGVLKALQEKGVEADVVAGTSAGSIVGAMYAAGVGIDDMMSFVKETSLFTVFKIGYPQAGLIKMSYIKKKLTKYLKVKTFEELNKPFYLTVTNLNTGNLEIVHSGDLIDSILASCAIPLIFTPIYRNDALYVDGGLIMNLPVSPIRPLCEKVIGVNVWPKETLAIEKINSVMGVAMRCFDLAIQNNTHSERILCDHVIEPKGLREMTIINFSKPDQIMQIGYDTVIQDFETIRGMLQPA